MKRYCGRDFSQKEMEQIIHLIAEDASHSRAALSRLVCEMFNWRKPDGGLKDMSCRVAMLRMQDDGLIQLPPPLKKKGTCRIVPSEKTNPSCPISSPVHELPCIQLKPVVSKKDSRLWNEYIQRYHYLGYTPLPGAQLRFFITSDNQLLGMFGFGASAWQTKPRDLFIGWGSKQRQDNLHLVVNNNRFLILPWIQSKNLASKALAMVAKQLPNDWQERYGYRPVLLETFVEQSRFSGTCYKAANWIHVGQTKGRGKLGPAGKISVPIKDIWLYPLSKNFKKLIKSK